MNRNMLIITAVCILCASSNVYGQETREGRHVATWSHVGHESQEHSWSFNHACEHARVSIEREFGPDWRLENITYEDLGRETDTSHKWTSSRRWEVSHTVAGNYKMVRRGRAFLTDTMDTRIKASVQTKYVMANPLNHSDNKTTPSTKSFSKSGGTTTHTLAHRHTEVAVQGYSHEETFTAACSRCYLEIIARHCASGDFLACRITHITFEDQGRKSDTQPAGPHGENPTRYTHSVKAVYKLEHYAKSDLVTRGAEKEYAWEVKLDYDMINYALKSK